MSVSAKQARADALAGAAGGAPAVPETKRLDIVTRSFWRFNWAIWRFNQADLYQPLSL
jgi:hypothetical protein